MSNEKILSLSETWADFWAWIKKQPEWDTIERERKQYLYKTARQMKEGSVGVSRLKKIFAAHAAGRYEYADGFIVHEE